MKTERSRPGGSRQTETRQAASLQPDCFGKQPTDIIRAKLVLARTVAKILETSRLVLREFFVDDADALARVLSDAETMRYYPAPYDQAGVEQWIARNRERYARDGAGLWAMVLKESGELIGDCGIIRQDVEGESLYEIGYHLRRDMWGQGLATEAAKGCREWGFKNLNIDTLISLVRPENAPSRRVAERNGMTVWKEIEWRGLRHYVYAVRRMSG